MNPRLLAGWSTPLVLVGLAITVLVAERRWPAHRRHMASAQAFAAGLGAIALALSPPSDAMADRLLSAHMLQHLMLASVAAPLLAFGDPFFRLQRYLPHRPGGGAAVRRARRVCGNAPLAAAVAVVATWVWHAPGLYDAARRNVALHTVEHVCFLVAGVVLWHAAVAAPLRTGRRAGQGLLALVASSVAIGALGALLAFSTRPWYPDYAARAVSVEVALTDQQVAGVLMWLATTPLLLAAAVALGARLLADAERRAPDLLPAAERAS